jgi:hypothetical protein
MISQGLQETVLKSTRISPRFPAGPLLRAIGDLDDDGIRPDRAYALRDARLLFADHELLQHDFPWLRGRTPEFRERWLLDRAAVMSATQVGQEEVNTPIATCGDPRPAWRPTRYGRALVVPGLLDVKGAGAGADRPPTLDTHGNGLLLLRDGLREVLFQWIVDEIFHRAEPRLWTVPVYGVIDCGFDAKTQAGTTEPAGLIVRRAHRRSPGNVDLPARGSRDEEVKFEIELLLRSYGITSANRGTRFLLREDEYLQVYYSGVEQERLGEAEAAVVRGWMRGRPVVAADGVNIQTVRELELDPECRTQLVDFGHYQVRDRFEDPVVSLAYGCVLRWGAALWPDDPYFPQPRPGIALPVERWGFGALSATSAARPKRKDCEAPTIFANGLARDFRAGRSDGQQVLAALREYISETVRAWE